MRKKNDGRGRMGGRAAGTKNRATTTMRDFLTDFADRNRGQIEADFAALEPRERLEIWVKLLPYVTPKLESVAAKIDGAPKWDDGTPNTISFGFPKVNDNDDEEDEERRAD
jgi:hypothetical protein